MAHESGGAGGTSPGWRGDGSPDQVRDLAGYLYHTLGGAMAEASALLGHGGMAAASSWQDERGEMFRDDLRQDIDDADTVVDQLQRAGRLLNGYADALQPAQDLIDQARDQTERAGFTVDHNGYVEPPPPPPWDPEPGEPPLDPEQAAHRYRELHETYGNVQHKVNTARDLVEDAKHPLRAFIDEFDRLFVVRTLIPGGLERYATIYKAAIVDERLDLADIYKTRATVYDDLRRGSPYPELIDHAKAKATDAEREFRSLLRKISGHTYLQHLARGTGGTLTIIGIARDINAGEPPDKVAIKAGAGVVGGAMGAQIGTAATIALFGPGAWVALGAGVGVVFVGGLTSMAAGWLYENYAPDRRPPIISDSWYISDE